MVKKNACVFISGQGTNLKNLILRSRDYNFPAKIKLVISNNTTAEGVLYAKKNWHSEFSTDDFAKDSKVEKMSDYESKLIEDDNLEEETHK